MLIKLIHPKTGTVREVEESNVNKIAILKRAGFILKSKYRPPKPVVLPPVKTASDVVQENAQDLEDQESVNAPEVAVHVSAAARVLIEENELDPALIDGSGKDGQITKPDVIAHLEALEVSNEELPDQPEDSLELGEEEAE